MAKRQEPPTLSPEERVKSFEEVEGVYLPHQAIAEAARCLFCHDAPCNKDCPAGIDIVKFIRRIKTKDFRSAIRAVRESNILAGVCARVCPTEKLCEKACSSTELTEPINIAALQRFVTDTEMQKGITPSAKAEPTGKKVAVTGSGPAGLAAAAELARAGHAVTIFEAKPLPGGVLTYGIPLYRLPKEVVIAEIDCIKQLGVEIKTDTPIDEKLNIDALFDQGFDAIFIATGVGKPYFVRMPGEDLEGVYSALELLSQVRVHYSKPSRGEFPLKIGIKALVIGGGNVAMDAACSFLRLGAEEVHVVCLESFEEMPAFPSEIEFAKEEGIVFHPRSKPLRIIGDENGRVKGFEGVGIRWKEPNNFSPSNAVPIEGTEFSLDVDTVVEAIGQGPDPSLAQALPGVETKGRGLIVVDEETRMTSRKGVFAGGDSVNGGDTVVQAIAEGKKAADGINKYLKSI